MLRKPPTIRLEKIAYNLIGKKKGREGKKCHNEVYYFSKNSSFVFYSLSVKYFFTNTIICGSGGRYSTLYLPTLTWMLKGKIPRHIIHDKISFH